MSTHSKKIAIAALTASLAFTGASQAKEVSVEEYVGALVSQTMVVVKQEMQYQIQAAVLTATNAVSFDEAETLVAKVTITDLNEQEADNNKTE